MARTTYAPRGRLKAQPGDDPLPALDPLRCRARSKRHGQQCKRTPIPGGTVCFWHGGAAPQVKLKALQRLEGYQDKAIDRLFELAEQHNFPSTAFQAVRDVLDRTMGRAQEKLDLNISGDAELMARLAAARTRNP